MFVERMGIERQREFTWWKREYLNAVEGLVILMLTNKAINKRFRHHPVWLSTAEAETTVQFRKSLAIRINATWTSVKACRPCRRKGSAGQLDMSRCVIFLKFPSELPEELRVSLSTEWCSIFHLPIQDSSLSDNSQIGYGRKIYSVEKRKG